MQPLNYQELEIVDGGIFILGAARFISSAIAFVEGVLEGAEQCGC